MMDRRLSAIPRIARLVGFASALSVALTLPAGRAPAADTNPAVDEPVADNAYLRWLKIAEEKGRSIGLQVAVRDFDRPDEAGPMVSLVGMAHIGEASFFAAAQELLGRYDVVLYESVKPPGAGGAGGETDEERVRSTLAALEFTAGLVELFHDHRGDYPDDLDDLRSFAAKVDPRLPQFLEAALVDAWGRALLYTPDAGTPPGGSRADEHSEPADAGRSYRLWSFGADGREGGEGIDADLAPDRAISALELAADDGLQGQLATALRLKFQLDALDYAKPNWRCSDMSMDQVASGLAEYGIDFGPLSGALAGSSFPAQLVKAVLGVLRIADAFVGGAIVDTFKVVMIEMLSDEAVMEQTIDIYGEGFSEVIINRRNQVVIDDLKRLITDEPEVRSVAILYGAAHLPDLARRLHDQLGYRPGDDRWLTAIEVDLTESAVTPGDIRQIRAMVKWMMAQQLPREEKSRD
ncbi:MAG: hypothetical protein JSV91_07285 [Phycisphaerales bacterium]|nr:MAG: hypothetical protein JSV91_07285 [Phycisphaerales bacterium]